MTTSSALRFEVVGTPSRRVVAVSPASRPDLHLPVAHPPRAAGPGRAARIAACRVARPRPRNAWLAAKVAIVSALAVVGGAVSVAQLADWGVDPALDHVAGDPGWGHVTHP